MKKKKAKKQGAGGRILAIVLAVLLTVSACGLVFTLAKKNKKWNVAEVEYNLLFGENFDTEYSDFSKLAVYSDTGPYVPVDTTSFKNKRITKISVPVSSVSAVNDLQYFTLVTETKSGDTFSVVDEYRVYLPKAELSSTTVNKWITIDLSDQYVYVDNNEFLGFSKGADPVKLCYLPQDISICPFYVPSKGTTGSSSLLFTLWGEDIVDLSGKTISVIGDSISTYTGINTDTTANTTIGNNAVYYDGSKCGITSADQTWWKQAVDSTGATLLVNNSWSGSKVYDTSASAAYKDRCVQLHSDTGTNKGKNPDIIAVYIGINDFDNNVELGSFEELKDVYNEETKVYVEPKNFAEAYAIMIHKMTTKYDKADIYVFTLPENERRVDEVELGKYNQTIRYIADYFGCKIVDLAGIEGYSCQKYCGDDAHLHPNQQGMDVITDLFVRALKGTYGKKKGLTLFKKG